MVDGLERENYIITLGDWYETTRIYNRRRDAVP